MVYRYDPNKPEGDYRKTMPYIPPKDKTKDYRKKMPYIPPKNDADTYRLPMRRKAMGSAEKN